MFVLKQAGDQAKLTEIPYSWTLFQGLAQTGFTVFTNRKRTDNTIGKTQKDKQRCTKHTHKTKDRVTLTPLNLGVN